MRVSIPTEVLEAVVDSVATSNSRLQTLAAICLSGKTLVTRAQMHIYRSIVLHPASDHAYSTQNVGHAKMYQTSLLLAKTLAERPHLADHVKNLRCSITTPLSPEDVRISESAAATSRMLKMEHFAYEFTNLSEATHDGAVYLSHTLLQSHVWLAAIAGILQLPTLRRLRLRNFRFFPPELLKMSRGVIYFDLHLTTIAGPKHFWDKISSHILDEYNTSFTSGAQELDITWHSSRDLPSRHFLSHCTRLRKLRTHLLSRPSERQSRMEWPVYSLHIEDLQSLTHFEVQVDTHLRGPDTILYYIYGPWRWDLVLAKLGHLEKLSIQLNFQGHLWVHPDSFGLQWGDIASALKDQPDAVPALKELALHADVRLCEKDSDQGEQMRDANSFLEQLREAVATYHSLALHGIRDQRCALSQFFSADISVGPLFSMT